MQQHLRDLFQQRVWTPGLYVHGLEGLSLVVGPRRAAYIVRLSIWQQSIRIRRVEGGGREAAGIKLHTGPASNVQTALVVRNNPKGDTQAVALVWHAMKFIKDPRTRALRRDMLP